MIPKAIMKAKPKRGVAKGEPNLMGRGRGWGTGAGYPSKYDPAICKKVLKLRVLGISANNIAELLEVQGSTLEYWRKKHPEFARAWDRGGVFADAKVAQSVFRRANGWEHESIKIFANGLQVPYIERYPGDTGAQELWLTNRQPDVWKKRASQEITGAGGKNLFPPPILVFDFSGKDGPLIEGYIEQGAPQEDEP